MSSDFIGTITTRNRTKTVALQKRARKLAKGWRELSDQYKALHKEQRRLETKRWRLMKLERKYHSIDTVMEGGT